MKKNLMTTKKLQNSSNSTELDLLREDIQKLKERNQQKELDKTWETSYFRKFITALLTYIVMTLFMGAIGVEDPEINAIVPTLGFILSTFSLTLFRKLWERTRN